MNFKNFFIYISVIFISSCASLEKETNIKFNKSYSNAGFALIYDRKYHENKIIKKKIDDRSLIIFQRNLKPNTNVKIINILNNKSIIASVGPRSEYPRFYNSVLSKRIATELDINQEEPYIKILEISDNSMFIAKKAKTFDEEKIVAEKAPVLEIGIKDLNPKKKEKKEITNIKKFSYVIKIADFYFLDTAKSLKKRILNEITINNVKINKISNTKFRVYLGPYYSLKSLETNYYKILKLEFENLEIIKL